jgi:hypothetical protein
VVAVALELLLTHLLLVQQTQALAVVVLLKVLAMAMVQLVDLV